MGSEPEWQKVYRREEKPPCRFLGRGEPIRITGDRWEADDGLLDPVRIIGRDFQKHFGTSGQ